MTPESFTAKFFSELTNTELYELLKARAQVFLLEQHIIYLDLDDTDYRSLHCFLWQDGHVVAYLRAYDADKARGAVKIGRVLSTRHGAGLGRALMQQSLPAIRAKMQARTVVMDAQKHAVGFYEHFGFRVTSADFLEEGIVHVEMQRDFA